MYKNANLLQINKILRQTWYVTFSPSKEHQGQAWANHPRPMEAPYHQEAQDRRTSTPFRRTWQRKRGRSISHRGTEGIAK
mmetsp:Transcript_25600/g.37828  ORF Transcript_25600/g.37828 Transcript_25600/m.37828 type:complete len:80 (-) Transcript_25600:1547-1786(-)